MNILNFKSFCNSVRIKSADAEMKCACSANTYCKYFKLKQFILEEEKIFSCFLFNLTSTMAFFMNL